MATRAAEIDAAALAPLPAERGVLERWLPPVITLALLGSVAAHLGDLGVQGMSALLPATPGFWLAMAVVYFALPATDWLIFRRVWRLPAAGFPIIVRKRIANELLLSYSGEVDFYLWARRRAGLTAAPFGTIKDVNILSALAAQAVTVVMLVAALPLLSVAGLGALGWQLWASIALLIAAPLGVFAVRRRLFTLPPADLRWIAGAHVARLLVSTAALGIAWHLALPELAASTWVALSAVRLVIARLPLVPGKDLLFAAVVPLMMGAAHPVADLVATVAAVILLAHIALAVALAGASFAGWRTAA